MTSHHRIVRSLLFVPGSRPEFVPKADAANADAIIFDLEDSVPPEAKTAARSMVRAAMGERGDRLTFVRVNHPSLGMIDDDLSVLVPHSAQAVYVPKVDCATDVLAFDDRLSSFERLHGLTKYGIDLIVAVESVVGLRALYDALHSTPRARGAVLASAEEGDLMVGVGGRWTPTGEALAYSRGKFVCDARAAGATWLIDGAFMNLHSDEALAREAELGRTFGFTGKIAIHPRQVSAINKAFSPTPDELARARRMIEAFRAAEAQGRGAVKFEGMMVDYANIVLAERILAMAAP